ncbi:MAG: hypothetical protein Q8918_16485 [Bacteroidota bacterium]|nr:hypothetical protein [Bacteroidota bacterium]
MPATTFITNEKGKKISAVLPIRQYEQLLEQREELEDIRAYDKAKAKKKNPSFYMMPSSREGKNKLQKTQRTQRLAHPHWRLPRDL